MHRRPQYGFSSIALVLTLFVLVGFIAQTMSFNSDLDLKANGFRKRHFYSRVALNDLAEEAHCWLAKRIAINDIPSCDHSSVKIDSMDKIRVLYSEDGGRRVSVYDLSFDVKDFKDGTKPSDVKSTFKKPWGHFEQDFYTPMPGAYLIRAVVEPLDEYAPEKLLEVVWALDEHGKLELSPRSKQEF